MKLFKQVLLFLSLIFLVSSCHKKEELKTITNAILTTKVVSQITNSTARCGGSITDNGGGSIIARGVCWSVNQFPIIEKDSRTIDGDGTGDFISDLINLQTNKTYYVRAYATNEVGTAYGDNVVFTTSPFATFKYNGETIYVHPVDNGKSVWGPLGVTTGAISTSDGSGNTVYISGQQGDYAAKICSDLVAYEYSDWYLPASEELNYMYQAKLLLGGFTPGDYWSSTETSDHSAASQNFQSSVQAAMASKDMLKICHCVRKG